MIRAITKLYRRVRQPIVGTAAALMLACQAVVPGAMPPAQPAGVAGQAAVQAPTFVLTPEGREAARSRLSGEVVSDFVNNLVSAPSRWKAEQPQTPVRRLQALGAASNANWAGGIDIRSAPFNCTGDMATNGFASRNLFNGLPKRVLMVTRNGAFLSLDPADPTVGFTKTALGDTFTKTYVTMSGDGRVAFVVSDNGKVFAINLTSNVATSPPSHTVRSFYLSGSPATKAVSTALFADPLASRQTPPRPGSMPATTGAVATASSLRRAAAACRTRSSRRPPSRRWARPSRSRSRRPSRARRSSRRPPSCWAASWWSAIAPAT